VSTTPVINLSPLINHTQVLPLITGVNDTVDNFTTGVNNTGGKFIGHQFIAGINDSGDKLQTWLRYNVVSSGICTRVES